MKALFGNATEEDFKMKSKVYHALYSSFSKFEGDTQVNTRHFAAAALELASVMVALQ